MSLRRSNESRNVAETRDVLFITAARGDGFVVPDEATGGAGVVCRSSRATADFEDEGEESGLVPGVRRNLFNFLDAAERLAPQEIGRAHV